MELIAADLRVRDAKTFAGDIEVCGWVEIGAGARLVCRDLTCLGIVVERGGALDCRDLVANYVEVDGSAVSARWIRARVVHTIQRGLGDVIDRGDLTAEYWQHFGGDLNPSWDYARGKLGLAAKFFSAREGAEWVDIDVAAIRQSMMRGESVFERGVEPLVTLAEERAPVAAASEPIVDELTAWLAARSEGQRQLLDAIRAEWIPRLESVSAEAQAGAARVIKQAIKSPKLAEERNAMLGSLAATAPAAPRTTRSLRVLAKDLRRQSPSDWLTPFALDVTTIDLANAASVEEIPPRIGNYAQLRVLQLAGNRIGWVAPQIGQLRALEKLDLSTNRLTALPAEIGALASLRELSLEWNEGLGELPDSLCDLAQLDSLSLKNTAISALPERFGALSSLSFLNLQGCRKLTTLPESFFALPQLRSILLHDTGLPGATLARLREAFPSCDFWNFFTARR